jgi:hypothetical protein
VKTGSKRDTLVRRQGGESLAGRSIELPLSAACVLGLANVPVKSGQAQIYMVRRTAQGMSKREIVRCLKRYVAREVYRCLMSTRGLTAAA